MNIVGTIDRVADAYEKQFNTAIKERHTESPKFSVFRHTHPYTGMRAGYDMPGVYIDTTYAVDIERTDPLWERPIKAEISVSVIVTSHRDNITEAVRLRDHALDAAFSVAEDSGFAPKVTRLEVMGEGDPRGWCTMGSLLLGYVDD